MAIYSGFTKKKMVIFHGYVSLPEDTPLKNMSRQLGLLSPTEWKVIKFMFQTTNQIPVIPCLGFQGIHRDNLFQRLPPNLTTTSKGTSGYVPCTPHQPWDKYRKTCIFWGGGCICSFQHNGKSRKQQKCMGMAHKWSVFRVNGGSCWCVFVREHPLYSAIILTHSHICRSHWFPSFPGWFQTIIIKPPGPQMLAS